MKCWLKFKVSRRGETLSSPNWTNSTSNANKMKKDLEEVESSRKT